MMYNFKIFTGSNHFSRLGNLRMPEYWVYCFLGLGLLRW